MEQLPAPRSPRSRTRATRRPKGPFVLIADDSEDAREMYGEYLATQGYRVVMAADGAEAVERARTCLPDIILMDLQMPRLDGWEAIRLLRSDRRTASILIVAVSAHAHDAARSEARAAGADACLTKPCLPSQVVMMIRAMLSWREIAAAPPPPADEDVLQVPNRLTKMSLMKIEY
jgi:two-component system, cell cycle response regulator DivK